MPNPQPPTPRPAALPGRPAEDKTWPLDGTWGMLMRIGTQDCHQNACSASALSGLFVIQQQALAGCQAGVESSSQGESVLMWAPRPVDQGNWVRMVGVRAPLPRPTQRPSPSQAVGDREAGPPDHCPDSLKRLI